MPAPSGGNGQRRHPAEGKGSASTQWREWAVPAPSGGSGHPVEGMGSVSTQRRERAVPAPSGGKGQCQHPVEGKGSASTQWREWAVPAGISVTSEKRTTTLQWEN